MSQHSQQPNSTPCPPSPKNPAPASIAAKVDALRSTVPVHQQFYAPSTTLIHVFNQPGSYAIDVHYRPDGRPTRSAHSHSVQAPGAYGQHGPFNSVSTGNGTVARPETQSEP